jgi:hypothetical protein
MRGASESIYPQKSIFVKPVYIATHPGCRPGANRNAGPTARKLGYQSMQEMFVSRASAQTHVIKSLLRLRASDRIIIFGSFVNKLLAPIASMC